MTKLIFMIAFLLGAAAVAWMGSNFAQSDTLGLTVIAVIGAVYAIGFIELVQFRRATSTLSGALAGLGSQSVELVFNQWLKKLHPSLVNAVRMRVEGERVGLPAPVLTPYLVGLLVMLGLLGTFVGMVDTLKGAVIALEGTTKLEAIRAGLAAPIGGLSLAFGTSVAGVAASAMLGLMSTLSRRDRMLTTRQLDTHISTDLKHFSRAYSQQETYKALQVQSQGLPEIAGKLNELVEQVANMTSRVGDTLLSNQQHFHETVKSTYDDLAVSVGQSLKSSLAESARLTGETIQPIVEQAMANISHELTASSQKVHQHLSGVVDTQLSTLTERFTETSKEVNQAWKEGLASHDVANGELVDRVQQAFDAYSDKIAHSTTVIQASMSQEASAWLDQQQETEKERLAQWQEALVQTQRQSEEQFSDVATKITDELKQVTREQKASVSELTQGFVSVSEALALQWQKAGDASVVQQQQIAEALQQTSREIEENAKASSLIQLGEMSRLLASSEELIKTRMQSETSWLSDHKARMGEMTQALREELAGLRDDESERGQRAIARLAELETTVAEHLSQLGASLEDPMTRLIETASETPRAAAEVIEQLRGEISKNIERDNSLLEERRTILADLHNFSESLQQTSTGQLAAVDKLVESSSQTLREVGERFNEHMSEETSKLSEITESISFGAADMSSLAEAFKAAITLYSESNNTLGENLNRIEQALDNSTARSDEQLGYYVAQAREVIDHSLLSQKEMVEQLRQLSVAPSAKKASQAREVAEVN